MDRLRSFPCWLGWVFVFCFEGCLDGVREGDITQTTHWFSGTRYQVEKTIHVLPGAALILHSGVRVEFARGAGLDILPGARLIAEGEPEDPIVLTSAQPLHERAWGDWAGLRIQAENSDCGRLRSVRLEFAGGDGMGENSSLVLAQCARGETLENVHVHRSGGQGVTLRGGEVDLRHWVVTASKHHGVSVEAGYHGKIQSLVVQQLENSAGAAWHMNPVENEVSEGLLMPVLSNVTWVGAVGMEAGAHAVVRNLVHLLRSTDVENSRGDGLCLRSSLIWPKQSAVSAWPLEVWSWKWGNAWDNPLLNRPWDALSPNFTAAPESPVFSSAVSSDPFFHTSENFVGAVGKDNWLQGWTDFPED